MHALTAAKASIIGIAISLVGVLVIYAAALTHGFSEIPEPARKMNHYSRQVTAWLAGQIALVKPPPQGLLELADPYDPSQNARFIRNEHAGLWDFSLYNGRLYLYFGAAPAVVTFLPYQLITGNELLPVFATLAFVVATFLITGLTLYRAWHMSGYTSQLLPLCLLVLGVTSLSPYLLVAGETHEVAVAAGALCSAIAVVFTADWLRSQRQQSLLIAAIALGVALWCRPHLILLSVPLAVVVLWRAWCDRKIVAALLGLLPIAFFGLAQALYNYLRFDSIFEFGVTYQLSAFNQREIAEFDIRNLPRGLFSYLVRPPELLCAFPYLIPSSTIPDTLRDTSTTTFLPRIVGLLFHQPYLLLVPFAWSRSPLIKVAISAAGIIVVVLSCFFAVIGRYAADMATLTALAGALACGTIYARGGYLARSLVVLLLLLSLTSTALLTSAQVLRKQGYLPPKRVERLQQCFNRP